MLSLDTRTNHTKSMVLNGCRMRGTPSRGNICVSVCEWLSLSLSISPSPSVYVRRSGLCGHCSFRQRISLAPTFTNYHNFTRSWRLSVYPKQHDWQIKEQTAFLIQNKPIRNVTHVANKWCRAVVFKTPSDHNHFCNNQLDSVLKNKLPMINMRHQRSRTNVLLLH